MPVHECHFLHDYSVVYSIIGTIAPGKGPMVLYQHSRSRQRVDSFIGFYDDFSCIEFVVTFYFILSECPSAEDISIEIVCVGCSHGLYSHSCLGKGCGPPGVGVDYSLDILESSIELKMSRSVAGRSLVAFNYLSLKGYDNQVFLLQGFIGDS